MAEQKVDFLFNFNIRGERAVERNLEGLIRRMTVAQSGADVAGFALEKLSRVFRVGLGTGLFTAALGMGIAKIQEMGHEALKVEDELKRLTNPNFAAFSDSEIDKSFEQLKAKFEEMREPIKHSFWEEFWRGAKDFDYKYLAGPVYKLFGVDLKYLTSEQEDRQRVGHALGQAGDATYARDLRERRKIERDSALDAADRHIRLLTTRDYPKYGSHKSLYRTEQINDESFRQESLEARLRREMEETNDPKLFKPNSVEQAKKRAEIQEKIDDTLQKRADLQNELFDLEKQQQRALATGFHVTSLQALGGGGRRRLYYENEGAHHSSAMVTGIQQVNRNLEKIRSTPAFAG